MARELLWSRFARISTRALRRIEARRSDEQERRAVLERDLATLRENVAVLTARIDEIERRRQS